MNFKNSNDKFNSIICPSQVKTLDIQNTIKLIQYCPDSGLMKSLQINTTQKGNTSVKFSMS